jgi:hypothetical protein
MVLAVPRVLSSGSHDGICRSLQLVENSLMEQQKQEEDPNQNHAPCEGQEMGISPFPEASSSLPS